MINYHKELLFAYTESCETNVMQKYMFNDARFMSAKDKVFMMANHVSLH